MYFFKVHCCPAVVVHHNVIRGSAVWWGVSRHVRDKALENICLSGVLPHLAPVFTTVAAHADVRSGGYHVRCSRAALTGALASWLGMF